MNTAISLLFFVLLLSVSDSASAAETITEECTKQFETVTSCLSFVTGKAATPTPACCTSIKGIRDSDPKCLCFIIQQAHNGSAEIKSLGIQEAKLLLLPSVCSLKNVNISECPKLLGISPSSPDAGVFNTTKLPAAPATTTVTSPAQSANDVNGASHGSHYNAVVFVFAMALIFLALPSPLSLFVSL